MASPRGEVYKKITQDKFKAKKLSFFGVKTKAILISCAALTALLSKVIYDSFFVPLGAPKYQSKSIFNREERFKEILDRRKAQMEEEKLKRELKKNA